MKKFFIAIIMVLAFPVIVFAVDPNASGFRAVVQDRYIPNPTLDAQKPYIEKAMFYLAEHAKGHEIDPVTSRPYLEEAYEAIKISRVMTGIKQAIANND